MFTTLKARLLVAGAMLGVAFIVGWTVQGWRMGEDMAQYKLDLAEASKALEKSEREREQALQARSDAVAQSILADLAAEHAQGRVIEKEVIRYVQVPGAGECNLLDDWVYIHDSAAAGPGAYPEPAGIPAAGSRQFTDIDVLPVITDNYETCRIAMSQVRGWIKWYAEVRPDAN